MIDKQVDDDGMRIAEDDDEKAVEQSTECSPEQKWSKKCQRLLKPDPRSEVSPK